MYNISRIVSFALIFDFMMIRFIRNHYYGIKSRIWWLLNKKKQKNALERLSGKKSIRCVFMALYSSTWKYDKVYKLMMKNSRFEPIILVCPVVNRGRDHMLESMKECMDLYKAKGYKVICSYDESKDSYVDLLHDLQPDIIFYTNPYKGLIDDRYFITNFPDVLSVYVPYCITCSIDINFSTNLPMHNLVWRKYVEYDYNLQVCKKHAMNKGRNVVVTGFPGIEDFLQSVSVNKRSSANKKKRIIWAPHHTLESCIYGHSCFILYADYMLEMAKKYSDDLFFIFKPHPLLKIKLYDVWGKNKTDEYYSMWSNNPNTEISEGEYIDLFLSSDAMIHDSGSFVVEYLYVNKPVMRTINDFPLEEQFNDFALSCLDNYYKGYNEQDIEQFIQNVINGVDTMKEQRTKFVNEVLMPKGSPSQNIIDDILDSIDNQILYRN